MNATIFILAFLAGASLGSFASAWALAWIGDRPADGKRSACGHCGAVLSPLQLAPIFSYILLRGKCGSCGGKIPAFHFFVELGSALICSLFVLRYGPTPLAVMYMILATGLVAAAACDLKARLLPNIVTLGGLLPALACVALNPGLTFADAILGYLLGGGIPLLLRLLFMAIRNKECLGLGDIKLFALGGALVGWQALPYLFLFSSLAGLAAFVWLVFFGRRKKTPGQAPVNDVWQYELPFGPFIVVAILELLLSSGGFF